jgi:hypothetical protein
VSSRLPLFAAVSASIHAGIFFGPPLFALIGALLGSPTTREAAGGGAPTGTGETAAVAGETFEVPELETPPEETSRASDTIEIDREPEGASASAPASETATAPEAASATASASARRGGKGHQASAPAPPPPPPLYGAVGDRAASDLVTSFNRAFPSAVSGDPQWDRVPVGFYAGGDVTFVLAPDGTLTGATVSANAAPLFRTALLRTFELLKHRVFTAKEATTRLHMVLRVSDQLTNHGAFTIDARGWFELRSGRRVTAKVTER